MKAAVLVAIDYFGQRGVAENDLPASVSSSKGLRAVLVKNGFEVKTLYNNAATRPAFYAAVREMFAKLRRPDDLGAIAWNGHAARLKWAPRPGVVEDIEVLVTHDALSTYAPPAWGQSIPPHFLKSLLSERRAGRLWLNLDVCYGGAFRQGDKRPSGILPQFTEGRLDGPFAAPPGPVAQSLRPLKTMAAVSQGMPNLVGFVPSARTEASVQVMRPDGRWEVLWTARLVEAARANPGRYYDAFKVAKERAESTYPLAHPQIFGDMASRMRPWLT